MLKPNHWFIFEVFFMNRSQPDTFQDQQTLSILDEYLATIEPLKILDYTYKHYDKVSIAFSGAEDVVLIDMAVQIRDNPNVFVLDTGRLHAETYCFIEQVRKHYPIDLEILTYDTKRIEEFIHKKGLFSFYEDGHQECCTIRKVEPLKRKLAHLNLWITGQRKDQAVTRCHIKIIHEDISFSTEENKLLKLNPLADWSAERVWQYIIDNKVPFNPLHKMGFRSIGCQPCTRPILPCQHEREGRWWWEQEELKECGLHQNSEEK